MGCVGWQVPVSVKTPGCDADDWSVPCYSPVHTAFTQFDPMYEAQHRIV